MSLSESKVLTGYNIGNVFYQRIKKHCKIFKGFVFLKTYIFVAHGRILSLYDMKKEKFIKHMDFSDDIAEVFRSQASHYGKEEFDVCVLLENGKIKFINQRPADYHPGEDHHHHEDYIEEDYHEEPSLEKDVEGKILQFDQDRDDNAWTFVLVEMANNVCVLQCLHDQKLYNISDMFMNHE